MGEMNLVTFELDGDPYAVELSAVREVMAPPPLRSADDTTPFLAGWAEVRGEQVPVLDLRVRFGMEGSGTGTLLLVDGPARRTLALLVDLVNEVSPGVSRPLSAVPSYFWGSDDLLRGLLTDGDRLTAMLNPAALLSDEEIGALDRQNVGVG